MTLRVLVVDDTAIFRKVVSDVLTSISDVQVIGTASNGCMALHRIQELQPDLITLDIEMPEMGGIDVLRSLRAMESEVGVLLLSALTRKGGELTLKALELGAFDFITKPSEFNPEMNKAWLRSELEPRLKAFKRRKEIQSILVRGNSLHPFEITVQSDDSKSRMYQLPLVLKWLCWVFQLEVRLHLRFYLAIFHMILQCRFL